MSVRLLCKQTSRRPSHALFYFPQEKLTGIGPVRIVINKQLDLTVGMSVTVDWAGDIVEAEIIALNGKSDFFNISPIHSSVLTMISCRTFGKSSCAKLKSAFVF